MRSQKGLFFFFFFFFFFITKLLTVLGRQGSGEIILSISRPVFYRTLFSAIDVLTSILWLFSNPEASGQECDFRRCRVVFA